jgi:hypothetical protein
LARIGELPLQVPAWAQIRVSNGILFFLHALNRQKDNLLHCLAAGRMALATLTPFTLSISQLPDRQSRVSVASAAIDVEKGFETPLRKPYEAISGGAAKGLQSPSP